MNAERSFETSETDYLVMRRPGPEKESSNFSYFYSVLTSHRDLRYLQPCLYFFLVTGFQQVEGATL
jgi:hypothetical protein